MARPQNFKRINVEDFPEKDRDLASRFASSMNIFAEDILNSLTKNLSIEDNLTINKKTIKATVDAFGVPVAVVAIKSELPSVCRGIQVIRAVNNDVPGNTPSGTPFITYSDNSGQLTISKITNLTAGEEYSLTVILYP